MKFKLAPSRRNRARNDAFTLIELMVSIGCAALLLGIILPATLRVRHQAQQMKCQSNIRALGTALIAYSQDFVGFYPVNVTSPAPGFNWYDPDRVGRYLHQPPNSGNSVFSCPCDDGAVRSYAMNFWASGDVDHYYPATVRNSLWKATIPRASEMILLAESWSSQGNQMTGFSALPVVGYAGVSESQRFGAEGGITPFHAGRFGLVNCELPYPRHRDGGPGTGFEPHGRVAFAFGDGHVECLSDDVLVNETTGVSSGRCVWYVGDPP